MLYNIKENFMNNLNKQNKNKNYYLIGVIFILIIIFIWAFEKGETAGRLIGN